MPYGDVPPAMIYFYPRVTIDMALCVAIHADGTQRHLVGNVHVLLTRLLTYPGRILTYEQIAAALLPELAHNPGTEDWYDLSEADQMATKRAIHMTVFHTRRALGESREAPSIILTRATLGYGIRHWLVREEPELPAPARRH